MGYEKYSSAAVVTRTRQPGTFIRSTAGGLELEKGSNSCFTDSTRGRPLFQHAAGQRDGVLNLDLGKRMMPTSPTRPARQSAGSKVTHSGRCHHHVRFHPTSVHAAGMTGDESRRASWPGVDWHCVVCDRLLGQSLWAREYTSWRFSDTRPEAWGNRCSTSIFIRAVLRDLKADRVGVRAAVRSHGAPSVSRGLVCNLGLIFILAGDSA